MYIIPLFMFHFACQCSYRYSEVNSYNLILMLILVLINMSIYIICITLFHFISLGNSYRRILGAIELWGCETSTFLRRPFALNIPGFGSNFDGYSRIYFC